MIIDTFLTPYFPETDDQFSDSIVVMIDVLRASTTAAAAIMNGAKEVIPTDSLDKAVKIYSSLSKEIRFLGGERNGLKPSGFDAGNSPLEYTEKQVKGKTVILTTTNGTKTFLKAKLAAVKLIAGFVNHQVIINYLVKKIEEMSADNPDLKIFFLCAGTNGRLSYEDMICAGALIYELQNQYRKIEITDPSDASKNLYLIHRHNLKEFLGQRDHAKKLKEIGFAHDIDIAFTFNAYPVVISVNAGSIKKIENI